MAEGEGATSAGPATIEVWIADPREVAPEAQDRWRADWLDDGERARAASARSASRQTEIVVGRALLRCALSHARPSRAPAGWRFVTAPGGRPSVAPEGQARDAAELDFSVAHTRALVACAVARGGRVGIDVEHRERRTEPLAIARRFFSVRDAAAVERASAAERLDRFLARWTLREACTKVLGVPLLELPRESVSFDVDAGGRVVAHLATTPTGVGEPWELWLLRPTPAHVLAVAWRGAAGAERPRVVLRRWPPLAVTG